MLKDIVSSTISSVVAGGILWNLGLHWKFKVNINSLIVHNKFTRYKFLTNNSQKYVKNVDKTCKIKNLIVE